MRVFGQLEENLYGRAELSVQAVWSQKLKALRDDDPPRHVSVIGWPSYALGKDLTKSIAQELAKASQLHVLSSPISK